MRTISNKKPVKAEITVVFKTCNLIDFNEFNIKYQCNIEKLVSEMLENYPLMEIIDDECVVLNVKITE